MPLLINTPKGHIAVAEAKVLHIPVIALLDSNADPDGVINPVPGNDDAIRAIALYCELISGAVLDGIQAELEASGGDAGGVGRIVAGVDGVQLSWARCLGGLRVAPRQRGHAGAGCAAVRGRGCRAGSDR